MIIKQLSIVLLCLIRAHEAAIPSISDLGASASEKKSKESIPSIHSLSSNLSRVTLESDSMNSTGSLLPFFKLSDRMNNLIGTISALDTKAAVEMIETELVQILDSGATLHDIAPTIGSLPIEAKKLVLAAVESKAYTLLRLLQKVYIWRDELQYHWFMALSYASPWYDKDMWEDPELVPLEWERNLWAVCEVESVALATMLREKALQGNALEGFDKELLLLCIEHDSIKVFESVGFKPIQLEGHIASLARNSAAKLLQLYQAHTGIKHLHLEEYPFPGKLPPNVEEFKFLMDNGYNFLLMEDFIKKSCKEGRLDLLKYLHGLNSKLHPDSQDFICVAAENFVDILDWARQINFSAVSHYHICATLLAKGHLNTLYWWINVNEIPLNRGMIAMMAGSRALEVLQWADNKQPGSCDFQEIVDSAAKGQYLPVLEWLYEKFKLLPGTECLEYVSGKVLDWMKSKSGTLESPLLAMRLGGIDLKYEDLIEYGPGNFELLQWVFNNSPSNVFDTKRETISKNIRSRETMIWLYDKLKICPLEVGGAYKAGDLEAIKWAAENCGIYPMKQDIMLVAEKGHLDVLEWIHENVYPKNPSCFSLEMFQAAISKGNLKVAEYLRFHIFPEEKVSVLTDYSIKRDKHLATLKWAHEHGFDIDQPNFHMRMAACNDDIETLEWIFANLPTSEPGLGLWLGALIQADSYRAYRLLLERYPKLYNQDILINDVPAACALGSLGILKVVHELHPSIFRSTTFSGIVHKKNYHAYQWLIANGYPFKGFN